LSLANAATCVKFQGLRDGRSAAPRPL